LLPFGDSSPKPWEKLKGASIVDLKKGKLASKCDLCMLTSMHLTMQDW